MDSSAAKPKRGVTIVCISDTHDAHQKIPWRDDTYQLPAGDILIHGGDFSSTGTKKATQEFVDWFGSQKQFKHRVFIAGNHDTSLDQEYYVRRGAVRFHQRGFTAAISEAAAAQPGPSEGVSGAPREPPTIQQLALKYSNECRRIVTEAVNCTYLEDSGTELTFPQATTGSSSEYTAQSSVFSAPASAAAAAVTSTSPSASDSAASDTVRIYGSPWQPEFCDWGFNLDRGSEKMLHLWSKIPPEQDVLITHGPPQGIGDRCENGFRCGCYHLKQKMNESPPRLHIFGHIHENYGAWSDGKTLFVNASTCNYFYRPLNDPIVVFLPFDRTLPAELVHCGPMPHPMVEGVADGGSRGAQDDSDDDSLFSDGDH